MGERGKKKATAAEDDGAGVSIRVSAETRQRLKVFAAQSNRTSKAIADVAIAEYLNSKKRGA